VLLHRNGDDILCPDEDTPLQIGDRILLAGRVRAARAVTSSLENDQVLEYLLTGRARPQGWVWQWLERRSAAS